MIPQIAQPMPSVLSVQDAIFPSHPFSGLFALGREQNWRLREMFPDFAVDENGLPSSTTRISYVQARESLLLARHIGGADLGILSGSRKSMNALGEMGQGMLAQGTLGKALAFGLEYQLIAGSMLQLELEVGARQSQLMSHALFDDRELQDFLDLDHLATAINAARSLPGPRLQPERVELRGNQQDSRSAAEAFFDCPVIYGADVSQVVFASAMLETPIQVHTLADPHSNLLATQSRHACDQELASIGVLGKQSLVRTLVAMQCECRSVPQMATALGISPRSLHRLLAREGASYFNIAESVRMGRAKRLLLQGHGTEAVAEQLDYSDERSFRRAFQRWTLLTPSEYRQTHQK
ncbi:AraC family transcriptional regulator [Undibacterium piscinae]|jgi:AraC-like DNA-binding protein|uniref:AraC family transcriptional regulator n=1 Tax=Undibacterium piscinae TaxID=2495591 RepID=A0A6M4A4X1_9BURK|nr:AraC family transcriptional regulator [Undibacterium piscinae]